MSPQELLERLLFDEELRERFIAGRAAVLAEAGVDPALFAEVDAEGLALDAGGRRRYLMSALCRAYPLSAAALGAALGPRALSAFLASPALFGSRRSAAFGDHLRRLTELSLAGPARELVGAVLALERGLVDNAAALRQSAAPPGPPPKPSSGGLKRGRIELPPYLILVELPCPPDVLRAALDGVDPGEAWARVEAGLDFDRVLAVSRGDAGPATVLARGYVRGGTRAGGGALLDLSHLSVTLSGRQGAVVQGLAGHRLGELPAARERLARTLLAAGVLGVG